MMLISSNKTATQMTLTLAIKNDNNDDNYNTVIPSIPFPSHILGFFLK